MRPSAETAAVECDRAALSQPFSPSTSFPPLTRLRMGHLLDIVHQAEQLPLRVHFLLAPKRKPLHSLVSQIPKDRLDDGDSLVVNIPPNQRVELPLHPFDWRILLLLDTPD